MICFLKGLISHKNNPDLDLKKRTMLHIMSLGGVVGYFFASRTTNSYRIDIPSERETYLHLMERRICFFDITIISLKLEILQRWNKVSAQNMRFCQNIPTPLCMGFIFPKSQPFSFFLACNLIGVSCDHDFFYWDKDIGLSDTPNILSKSTENFLDVLEKKCQLKKWGKKLKIWVGMFWQNVVF